MKKRIFSLFILCAAVFFIIFLTAACDNGSDGSEDSGGGSLLTYKIGDTGPGGGLVFYITDGGAHGLEVTKTNLSTSSAWICGESTQTTENGNTGTDIGTGPANTDAIIAQAEAAGNTDSSSYAAGVAKSCSEGGYADWYLPSFDALEAVWDKLVDDGTGDNSGVGNFDNTLYWSSSEIGAQEAMCINFQNGFAYTTFSPPKQAVMQVRAIRSF